jgi:hypothetical protein
VVGHLLTKNVWCYSEKVYLIDIAKLIKIWEQISVSWGGLERTQRQTNFSNTKSRTRKLAGHQTKEINMQVQLLLLSNNFRKSKQTKKGGWYRDQFVGFGPNGLIGINLKHKVKSDTYCCRQKTPLWGHSKWHHKNPILSDHKKDLETVND